MHSASHLESAVYSYFYQIHILNSMAAQAQPSAHLKTPEDLTDQFRSRSDFDPADSLGRTRRGGESHPSDLQYGVPKAPHRSILGVHPAAKRSGHHP
ncbi:hypothetical protein V8C43DRAFT_274064 [Trichoderma afarasin]